jgi:uncharacterized protein YndB with AHSA1/START domain
VTQRAYATYLKTDCYWIAVGCDRIANLRAAIAHLDIAVSRGVSRARNVAGEESTAERIFRRLLREPLLPICYPWITLSGVRTGSTATSCESHIFRRHQPASRRTSMSDPGLGARPVGNEVIVERSISVPVERAYHAWADPAQVAAWFTTHAEQDVRVGGRYSNADGDSGEYLEVQPGERLRFTWEQPKAAPGSNVTVEFVPEAEDIVTVRITHNDLTADDVAGLQDGWDWALDSLKSYLETGAPVTFEDWQSRKEMGY